MKVLILSIVLLSTSLFTPISGAAETDTTKSNQETLSVEETKPAKVFKKNEEIQDMELKAESGAQTRWSMKASLGYSGPSLAEPLSDKRRNPDGRFTDVRTSLGGSVGLRYRMTQKSTLNFGTGVSAVKPFHGVEQLDAQDPFLSIDRSYKWGGVQWYSQASQSVSTTEFYRDIGQWGGTSFSQSGRFFVPDSQWTLGFNSSISFFHYERPYSKTSPHGGSNYFVGFYPNAAYRINSRWMVNTSSAFTAANRRYFKDWSQWDLPNVTQRVGLGWSVTREIYFSPYVNFFWKDPNWKTSNFAFSTIFSVF